MTQCGPDDTEPQVQAMFRYSTGSQVGDGKQTSFSEDGWIHGISIAELAPCLVQAVGSGKHELCMQVYKTKKK